MRNRYRDYEYWEAEQPVAGQAPDVPAVTPNDVSAPPGVPQPKPEQPPEKPEKPKEDITKDPKHADLPEEHEDKSFDDFKNDFFKLAIKGDAGELVKLLRDIDSDRKNKEYDATQNKFIEDNLLIQLFRQDSNIDKPSKEIRKMVKDQLDKNFPATTLMQHLSEIIEKTQPLSEVFQKLVGFYGMKGDLHRKFVAALFGAVQVGGGGSQEDLVYSEKEYSINISTRFASEWGEVSLGKWTLQSDDPERYLKEPELDRMKSGSPEEKHVLRHRIVIDSISERFKTRAYLLNVTQPDGSIHFLGWDLADSLQAGYKDGRLIVKTKASDSSEAMIDDDGNVIPITDLNVYYVKDLKKPEGERTELDFMEKIDGVLYLTANLETIRHMATSMSGVFFKEQSFNGNPAELKSISRNIPSLAEMLLRRSQ